MSKIPDRRDAAGVDKAADISAALNKNPLLNGRIVDVDFSVSGPQPYVHGLGRPYQGAILIGIHGMSGSDWAAAGFRVLTPQASEEYGWDITKRFGITTDFLPPSTVRSKWLVF